MVGWKYFGLLEFFNSYRFSKRLDIGEALSQIQTSQTRTQIIQIQINQIQTRPLNLSNLNYQI